MVIDQVIQQTLLQVCLLIHYLSDCLKIIIVIVLEWVLLTFDIYWTIIELLFHISLAVLYSR